MQWARLPTMPLGPPLASNTTLNDGSTQAHKRRFLARLRRQIPVVVEAFRKTPHRDKRNFDHPVATRNADVKIGDYVYTTKNNRQHKMKCKATGPFVVLNADATTFDMNIVEEEMRVSSDHVTAAPRPTTTNTVHHVLKDGINEPKHLPATADGYVIDKLLGSARQAVPSSPRCAGSTTGRRSIHRSLWRTSSATCSCISFDERRSVYRGTTGK